MHAILFYLSQFLPTFLNNYVKKPARHTLTDCGFYYIQVGGPDNVNTPLTEQLAVALPVVGPMASDTGVEVPAASGGTAAVQMFPPTFHVSLRPLQPEVQFALP